MPINSPDLLSSVPSTFDPLTAEWRDVVPLLLAFSQRGNREALMMVLEIEEPSCLARSPEDDARKLVAGLLEQFVRINPQPTYCQRLSPGEVTTLLDDIRPLDAVTTKPQIPVSEPIMAPQDIFVFDPPSQTDPPTTPQPGVSYAA